MDDRRIFPLNADGPDSKGKYVLYWMQQSQRADFNPALEYAARRANRIGCGLIVGFGLTDSYPEANERHYAFMLEGLREVRHTLQQRRIKVVASLGSPEEVALDLGREAVLVVCDSGHLRHQRRWRERVATEAGKEVVEVEGDVVVPVTVVSEKVEYAARTIRPKLTRLWPEFLEDLRPTEMKVSSLPLHLTGDLYLRDPEQGLKGLGVNRAVGRVTRFRG